MTAFAASWRRIRAGWDRVAIYLPIILMGVLALGTYWLARNTPVLLGGGDGQKELTHDPDYFMRGFSVKTFDANGRLKTEVFGTEARHYPDTDTLEIDDPRVRTYNENGAVTVATGKRAISNGDGSEVQLMGNAVVTREQPAQAKGQAAEPRMEFRGEFLHVFVNTEKVRSHLPVTLTRGSDQFTADRLDYDNLDRLMQMQGRVRGTLAPPGQP